MCLESVGVEWGGVVGWFGCGGGVLWCVGVLCVVLLGWVVFVVFWVDTWESSSGLVGLVIGLSWSVVGGVCVRLCLLMGFWLC